MIALVWAQGAMGADEPGFGDADTGYAGQDPQVTGQATAARVSQTLAITEQQVRGNGQTRQGGKEGGHLAKGQQPRDIGESGRLPG